MKGRLIAPVRIAELDSAWKDRMESSGAAPHLFDSYFILPGFTDVHVHLREPGFSYKETILTGTMAAAAGGFTHIVTMPNLNPVPDSLRHLQAQLDIIKRDARVGTHPLGSLTRGENGEEVADIEAMAPFTAGFSDDGVGVMDDGVMREAMQRVKAAGSIAVAHCEDSRYPRESRDAEWRQLERDLLLAEETGCPYHMCHVSTAESLALIREAKRAGLDVTCETAPHYLTLTAEDCEDDGRFKMNPPIKEKQDRDALLEAVSDGTADMIATDHAPHSAEEKSRGFAGSAYGIVGLETAFPVLYTSLVREGIITAERLVEMLTAAPNRRFGIDGAGPEEYSVWDLETPYTVDPESFLSKGRSTPFAGRTVFGKCLMTVKDGRIVYKR